MRTLSEHNNDVIARGDQREPDDEAYQDSDSAIILKDLDAFAFAELNTEEGEVIPDFDPAQFDGMTTIELITALDLWQQRKDKLEALSKRINGVYDFLRITRIPSQFDDEGITNITVSGIGRCALTADMHVSVAAGKKDDAYTWLRDTNRGDVITETVNASTLKAIVKKAMLAAEQLPDGLFNVSPFSRAAITRK